MAITVTARTTQAYDSGRFNHPITAYRIVGDNTTATDILAHGSVDSEKMIVAVEGHISVAAATQIKFISKPSGSGTEIAWLDFPARGVQPIPAFHCEPGEGLQIQSTSNVAVRGEVKIGIIKKQYTLPALS